MSGRSRARPWWRPRRALDLLSRIGEAERVIASLEQRFFIHHLPRPFELLEFSVVPVPANPDCYIKAP